MNESQYIFIIGAPRSGTTFLGKILQMHPDVFYIEEPKPIWNYRNCKEKHEAFPPELATPKIKNYIRLWFRKRAQSSNKKVLIEKTPTNALRPLFIYHLFPNSKFIFLYRNGYDAAASAKKKWESESDKNSVKLPGENKKFRQLRIQIKKAWQVPFLDKPYYVKTAIQELIFHLTKRKRAFWGPKYPGYLEDLTLPSLEICARQWAKCIDQSKAAIPLIPEPQRLEVHYLDLIHDYKKTIEKIFTFCELNKNLEESHPIYSLLFPTEKPTYSTNNHSISSIIEPRLELLRSSQKHTHNY